MNRVTMSGRRCVRVLERGKRGTRRLHIHAITSQYWPVALIRKWAELAGFGRINVKAIPLEKAYYVAKYVVKDIHAMDTTARLWSCVGFQGATKNSVICKIKVDTAGLQAFPYYPLCDGYEWGLGDLGTITFRTRETPSGQPIALHYMELKAMQQKEVLASVLSGVPTFVGQYRGYQVRTISFTDRKTNAQVSRVTVEHNVEVAGVARAVVEWLPQGADAKAVKPLATQGDVVMVSVRTARRYGGQTQYDGDIRVLSQLV